MAGEISRLLIKWGEGDQTARDHLITLVYEELRRLAANYLRRERRNHSLQPTALVHEAYLHLIGQQHVSWQNRAQFFGMAAAIMRNILVSHARRHGAVKRGADYTISLSEADALGQHRDVSLVAMDDALQSLAAIKPQHSKIVELRFFSGLTIEETAEVLGLSHSTVERNWSFARAWLQRELSR